MCHDDHHERKNTPPPTRSSFPTRKKKKRSQGLFDQHLRHRLQRRCRAVAKLATQFPKQFGAVIDFSKKYGFYFFMAIMFVLVSTGLLFFIVIL